jgi:hypothetical protein
VGLTTHPRKKQASYENHKKHRTWTDSLDKGPKRKKMDIRFGNWNVRSMHRAGWLRAVAKEISKYKLDLVGVQEVRGDGGGTEPAGEYIVTCTSGTRH